MITNTAIDLHCASLGQARAVRDGLLPELAEDLQWFVSDDNKLKSALESVATHDSDRDSALKFLQEKCPDHMCCELQDFETASRRVAYLERKCCGIAIREPLLLEVSNA